MEPFINIHTYIQHSANCSKFNKNFFFFFFYLYVATKTNMFLSYGL